MINLKKNRPIINLLGEICWGFNIDNFKEKIGAEKAFVETLLERLVSEEKKGTTEVYLDSSEVAIIQRALNEAEKEIEDWEFHARIGVSLEQVKKIPLFR